MPSLPSLAVQTRCTHISAHSESQAMKRWRALLLFNQPFSVTIKKSLRFHSLVLPAVQFACTHVLHVGPKELPDLLFLMCLECSRFPGKSVECEQVVCAANRPGFSFSEFPHAYLIHCLTSSVPQLQSCPIGLVLAKGLLRGAREPEGKCVIV